MSLLSSLLPTRNAPAATPATATTASATPSAPTDLGPALAPRHELTEHGDAFALTVDLPGVGREDLELTVDHEQVRVVGRRAWRKPSTWSALHRETREGRFELALAHGRSIDPEKIHAELRDGVLRVSLPKAEALRPRRVTIA